MPNPSVNLELTADQALVFFDWLARRDERDDVLCEHAAEERVFWALHGQLERRLVEPFKENYRELLAAARARVDGE